MCKRKPLNSGICIYKTKTIKLKIKTTKTYVSDITIILFFKLYDANLAGVRILQCHAK